MTKRWRPSRGALAAAGSLAGFAAVRLRNGITTSRDMVEPYAQYWQQRTQRAASAEGPVWAVLGDSTAQGIGASAPDRGYVGQVQTWLEEVTDQRWWIANLSRSGARAADVAGAQLDALEALEIRPELVTLAVGANDLRRTPVPTLLDTFGTILARLPADTIVATLPQGLRPRRATVVNDWLRATVPQAALRLADVWNVTGPPYPGKYAGDWFHPNETGYSDWAAAFVEVLEQMPAQVEQSS